MNLGLKVEWGEREVCFGQLNLNEWWKRISSKYLSFGAIQNLIPFIYGRLIICNSEGHSNSFSSLYLFIHWCGPFLKSLLNLLQHCFFFMSWCFGHESCVILASRPGIEPIFTTVEDEDLTIGLPGKCQRHSHINPILKKQSGNILPQSAFWQHVTKIQISEWFALRFYCGMRDTKTENSISVATGVYRDFCNVACWRQWSC